MSARRRTPLADRLLDKIVAGPDGCWIFTGAIQRNGYGAIGIGGREVGEKKAHIVSFEHFTGQVPPGADVGHACHDRQPLCPGGWECLHRRCIRPDHLSLQSRSANLKASGRVGQRH